MTPKAFNAIVKERISKIKSVLAAKGSEYGSVDRLHNFKAAAAVDGETQLQAAWGMFKKHLVSVKDMKDGVLPISEYMINEKIGDAIIYLILMEAIMIEEMESATSLSEVVKKVIQADIEKQIDNPILTATEVLERNRKVVGEVADRMGWEKKL